MVSLRERLDDDEAVLGTFVTLAAPEVVELAGWVGLDFVVLDLEHGGLSSDSITPAVRAADGVGLDVIVRIPEVRRGVILTALDAGAAGIQVPQVTQPEQARQAVRQSRFSPDGERGAALGRSARFGLQGVDDYFREANANTVVTVQCESREALRGWRNWRTSTAWTSCFWDRSITRCRSGNPGSWTTTRSRRRPSGSWRPRGTDRSVRVFSSPARTPCGDATNRAFGISSFPVTCIS